MRPRRREPTRTCVGCRTTGDKRRLLRVIRWGAGSVALDLSGKAPGRGAYLHPDPACWSAALKRGALARALRTALSAEEAGTLLMHLREATSR